MSTNQQPWYSEEAGFFGPDYLVEYQETLPHEKTLQQVDFLENILSLQQGMNILDVPCGHGRHSVELAKRGYKVTGVELNNFFLSEAKKAAEAEGVNVKFQQGDMREIKFDSEFDVALNLFTSMGYFEDDEDDRTFMAGIHRALKVGGHFVIDFISRDWLVRNFKDKDWRELPDGSTLLIERSHDPIRGRNTDRRIRIRKGEAPEETVVVHLRVYTPTELVRMAESVGLNFKEAYGDYEGVSLSMSSKRVILVFTKAQS